MQDRIADPGKVLPWQKQTEHAPDDLTAAWQCELSPRHMRPKNCALSRRCRAECWGHIERSKPKIKCHLQKTRPLTTEHQPVDSAKTEDEALTVHGEPSTFYRPMTRTLWHTGPIPVSYPLWPSPLAINRARTLGKSASSIRSAASLALSGS